METSPPFDQFEAEKNAALAYFRNAIERSQHSDRLQVIEIREGKIGIEVAHIEGNDPKDALEEVRHLILNARSKTLLRYSIRFNGIDYEIPNHQDGTGIVDLIGQVYRDLEDPEAVKERLRRLAESMEREQEN